MHFTGDTPKTYETSVHVHQETGREMFLEALLHIETGHNPNVLQ